MNPPVLQENPFHPEQLDAYRRECRKRVRASLVGAHTTRKRGQSLEFREYAHYMPGDDFRHIDWRASARVAGATLDPQHLLVRRFIAEEKFKLVISLDTRESMFLPEGLSKLQVGAWLAESLAWIALRQRDEVGINNLFGQGPHSYTALPSGASLLTIRHQIARFLQSGSGDLDQPDFRYLVSKRHLPPASIWVIITDLYFRSTAASRLADLVQRQRDSTRWVIIAEMDTLDYELGQLGEAAEQARASLKILGPDLPDRRFPPPIDIESGNLGRIRGAIDLRRAQFHVGGASGEGGFRWTLPAPKQDGAEWFRNQFVKQQVLRRLYVGES